MKRVLCVLLLALIVPVLLLPASAVDDYIFERVPQDIMLFDSAFEFLSHDGAFVYPGRLPDGEYNVVFSGAGEDAYLLEPFSASFSDFVLVDDEMFPGVILDCVLVYGRTHYPLQVSCFYFADEDCTVFVDMSGFIFSLEFADSACFSLVASNVPSLADFISVDSLSGVLSEIGAVFPVILVVLVGYIAIRKGLAWVSGLISGT